MQLPLLIRWMSFSPSTLCGACLALVFGGFVVGPSAQAQGFSVSEQGTCVMGRAGATVATGCEDGSSMFFNPANLTSTEGITASLGATLIGATGSFTYDALAEAPSTGRQVDLTNDLIPVPHGYLSYRASNRVALGLGVYTPYGLETQWPTELDDGSYFDGAFEGFDSRLQSIYIQPTFSIQASDRLRVGFGPVIAVSKVELKQLQDLSQAATPTGNSTFGDLGVPFHTAFARSNLESDTETGFGLNLGLSYQVTDRLRIGGRYTSPITVSFDGEASFEQISTGLTVPVDLGPNISAGDEIDNLVGPQFSGDGNLTTQSIETKITFPMQIVGGVSFQATDALLLLADYQFTQWSSFDEIPLQFEKLPDESREQNYNDTHAVRLGAEYEVFDELTARAGYIHNTAAAPDEVVTPLLPENERNSFTIGAGWRPVDLFEVNASYMLLQQNDRRGRVQGPKPGQSPSTDLNQGLYEFGANLFAATFTLRL